MQGLALAIYTGPVTRRFRQPGGSAPQPQSLQRRDWQKSPEPNADKNIFQRTIFRLLYCMAERSGMSRLREAVIDPNTDIAPRCINPGCVLPVSLVREIFQS